MGREIRRVPANWEHPKHDQHFGRAGQFKPLFEDYEKAIARFAKDIKEKGLAEAIEYNGGGPRRDDYVNYEGKEPTWWQVYETVTEGTPVSPPFATQDELVDYLVARGDFWDQMRGDGPWSRKNAEAFVKVGWAPSGIVTPEHGFQTGIEALGYEKP